MTKTFDLNNPKDARAYLIQLENEGKLTFETGERAADLTDLDALDAAKITFAALTEDCPDKVQ